MVITIPKTVAAFIYCPLKMVVFLRQMVFGKSNIIGDLQIAIDNAFNSLVTIRNNSSEELRIVESTIFAQTT